MEAIMQSTGDTEEIKQEQDENTRIYKRDNQQLIFSTWINYESVAVDFVYCYNNGRGEKWKKLILLEQL